MSAAKSTFLASALLSHVLGGPDYTRPDKVYVALLTAMPATDGGTPTECAAGGYARAEVKNDTASWTDGGDGSKSNASAVLYTVPPGSWGTIVGFALYDATTGGNLLYYGPLDNSLAIAANETVQFQPGALIVAER